MILTFLVRLAMSPQTRSELKEEAKMIFSYIMTIPLSHLAILTWIPYYHLISSSYSISPLSQSVVFKLVCLDLNSDKVCSLNLVVMSLKLPQLHSAFWYYDLLKEIECFQSAFIALLMSFAHFYIKVGVFLFQFWKSSSYVKNISLCLIICKYFSSFSFAS